jgi:hypothetical protein
MEFNGLNRSFASVKSFIRRTIGQYNRISQASTPGVQAIMSEAQLKTQRTVTAAAAERKLAKMREEQENRKTKRASVYDRILLSQLEDNLLAEEEDD